MVLDAGAGAVITLERGDGTGLVGLRAGSHDRGRVIRDLAVMLAGGGDCLADLRAVSDQAALRTAAPEGAAGAVPPPTPEFRADVVVRNLVSDLASMKRRVVLVIDDAHEIADPEILDGLRYLLEHLPRSTSF